MNRLIRALCLFVIAHSVSTTAVAFAQPPPTADSQDASPVHDHAAMMAAAGDRWHAMWDGVVFATVIHEGGPRGGNEVRSQNWLMLGASRRIRIGVFSASAMLSAEPATVGARGYRELFQLGEAYKGLPVVDRQHPHDAFMQLAVEWRFPIRATTISVSGGPSSSPALGPTAFPHRLSASENPIAPLTHHTFDSTHVTFGVATLGVQHGWVLVEASAFHGREPDWRRWNVNHGALDSGSARLTVRPRDGWEFQVSRGHLHQPEELEPGNQTRTNASWSWTRTRKGGAFTAITLMTGRVSRTYSWTGAFAAEGTHWMGNTAIYGRYEGTGVETEHLLFPTVVHKPHPGELVDPLHALTGGLTRRVQRRAGVDVAVGARLTIYRPPTRLLGLYGNHPVSAAITVRVRPLHAPMTMSMP